jgi:chemotaxis protein MotA
MSFIFGTLLGLLAIRLSLVFLHQSIDIYFDDVAMVMVFGGTLAIGIISAPWHNHREIWRMIVALFFKRNPKHTRVIEAGLQFVQEPHQEQQHRLGKRSLAAQTLRDGQELLSLNFTTQDLEIILQERIHQALEKQRQVAEFFQSLAKYPPAFGLVGTVLGLVNLMRAMTDGMDPSQTGIKMALALVATLYGLIVANFLVAPVAEAMHKRIQLEQFHADIALQAVLLASDRVSLLKSQELLNSYIDQGERINVISRLLKEAA